MANTTHFIKPEFVGQAFVSQQLCIPVFIYLKTGRNPVRYWIISIVHIQLVRDLKRRDEVAASFLG